MKIKSLGSVLAKRFGVEAARDLVPWHPTLGDVDSPEALEEYQAAKRNHKEECRRRPMVPSSSAMAETTSGSTSEGGAKPILLAAAMAFLALNLWTGSPLLALWIGSRVQGTESQPSMGAFTVVILA